MSPLPQPIPGNLLQLVWDQRRMFRTGMALSIMRVVVVAPFPILFQMIVDDCISAGDPQAVIALSLIVIGLCLFHYIFSIHGARHLAAALARLNMDLRGSIYYKIQFLSFGYLDEQKTGRLLSKYAFDTQRIDQVLFFFLNQIVVNLFYSFAILIVMLTMNWKLVFILLGIIPFYAIAKNHFFVQMQERNKQARVSQESLTGTANEYISAIRLVRSLGEEEQVRQQLDDSSQDAATSRVEMLYTNSVFGTFSWVAMQILTLAALAGGAIFVINESLTMGTLVAFLTALPVLFSPVHLFTAFSEQYFLGQESYKSIKELLDSTYVEDWKGTNRPASLRGDIQFDEVSFTYSGKQKPVLRDFSLHIRPGEKIALVGPSGSGKSTIANLLIGLYKPSEGAISIDDFSQEVLDMRWLRRQVSLVMQESFLLSGTIADNIRFAKTEATDEEMFKAARLANCEEFIRKLPHGYDTLVGERGATLSGGQRQRLSIARSILRDPAILILDEPTSALDYESEKIIQEALDRLAEGRTVITIAHRLSTIKKSDRVIVLREGRIVEQGSFSELSRTGGYFAQLLAAQSF